MACAGGSQSQSTRAGERRGAYKWQTASCTLPDLYQGRLCVPAPPLQSALHSPSVCGVHPAHQYGQEALHGRSDPCLSTLSSMYASLIAQHNWCVNHTVFCALCDDKLHGRKTARTSIDMACCMNTLCAINKERTRWCMHNHPSAHLCKLLHKLCDRKSCHLPVSSASSATECSIETHNRFLQIACRGDGN